MNTSKRSWFSWHLIGTFLVLAATLTASKLTAHRKSEFLAKPLDTIDRQILGFTASEDRSLDERTLHALNASSYLLRTYSKANLRAELFIAFYAQQRAGESMHSPKHCLPGAGWEIWDHGITGVPVEGRNFEINQYSVSHEGQHMLVLYWYQSKNRVIASEYMGKILLTRDTLLQNSTAASIVRVSVPDQPGALEDSRALASQIIPQVRRCFGD